MTDTALGGTSNGATESGNSGANAGNTTGAGSSSSGHSSSGSEGAKSWRDSLPEDIRANAALSSFQDIGSLAKSFIHSQSMVGKKGVVVPGEKATESEWQTFYQNIGVPAADKYELKGPQDHKIEAPVMAEFKEQALKNGLLPKQAEGLLGWYSKFEQEAVKKQAKEMDTHSKQQLESLKKEWGEGYDRQISAAQFAVKETGGDELVNYLNKTGLGNDVVLIKHFSKVAKLLGEDKLREGGVTNEGMTPSEINAQLAELRANGDQNGLYDKNHPSHAVTLAKMESLAKRLTGGR